jgi:hypothetical protein
VLQLFKTGAVRVWNELYSAKAALGQVVARDDPRWHRVPLSIKRPRLADLKAAFREVGMGSVVVYDGASLDWMK